MAHSNHSNVTLRFKLVYTSFTIDIENFNLRNATVNNTINQIRTRIAREMGINNIEIILAGDGENSRNRNITSWENIRNEGDTMLGEALYVSGDGDRTVRHDNGYWAPSVDVISFYVSPIDNRMRNFLENNAPNPNINSMHDVMYVIHQLNTDYEGASGDSDDNDDNDSRFTNYSGSAAGDEPEPPPEAAAASPTSITINPDNNSSGYFQGECCVCYTQTSLSHHYSCNLSLNVNHGLCDNCWNQWRNRNNTCPVCRAPSGTPNNTNNIPSLDNSPSPMPDVNNNTNIVTNNNIPDEIMAYIANRPTIRVENNTIVISNVDYSIIHNLENRLNIMNNMNNDSRIIQNNLNYIIYAIIGIINNTFMPFRANYS